MDTDQLKALQAPLKSLYRENANAARQVLRATGVIDRATVSCRVETPAGTVSAGLHTAVGGDASWACSGDMLLQSLVACAGVTLAVVATAIGIELRAARVEAEGDLDFRGTLGIARDVPVGFSEVRLNFHLETDALAEQTAKLLELTERYCVIYQTLKNPPTMTTRCV